ncbi:hypothetical protein FOZ63_013575, partial [Perkinsus olseni]
KVQALARESPTTTLEQLTVTIRDQLRASRLDEAGIQASALVGPIAAKGKGKGKGRYGKGKGRMGKGVMNPDYSQVICYDCGQKGHIQRFCPRRGSRQARFKKEEPPSSGNEGAVPQY